MTRVVSQEASAFVLAPTPYCQLGGLTSAPSPCGARSAWQEAHSALAVCLPCFRSAHYHQDINIIVSAASTALGVVPAPWSQYTLRP
jgi:hypothetical protein